MLPFLDLATQMAQYAKRPATYADVLGAPEHMVAEIIDGEMFTQPRPSAPHALAATAVGAKLFDPFHSGKGGPGGWIILIEPELHLHGHVLVPDLAGWRRERLPEVPDSAAFELAPDWIAEVLSPSTAAIDRVKKLPIYAKEQVRHIWLVEPMHQTLEVYRLDGATYRVIETWDSDAKAAIEPFDAIVFELGALWAR